MKAKLTTIKDGFKNVIKGLGTRGDSRTSVIYSPNRDINYTTANDLYTSNWLAAKVVDTPIDDATRKWRSLLIPDPEKKAKIEEAFKKYGLKNKINLAMKWSRVFGGSVIVIIIDGDDQEEALDLESIKKDSLKNLVVLDRYNIHPEVINRDILSENYGKPDFYIVSRGGQRIHYSRVIRFEGSVSTIRQMEKRNFWGSSIYKKLFDPIMDSQTVSNSISNLIYESNVDVYRVEGLYKMVAEGNDDLVVKRLKIAHQMKSIINAVVLDQKDEYDKKSNTFANLPEIDDRFIQKVAGASNIPVTRLLGISPAGQNATGESDMRNYYDSVSSLQENEIRPKLTILDTIILASVFGKYESFEYEFLPLQQLTDKEQAEVDLQKAQRDQIYLDLDVIESIDSLSELAENGTYNSIDENRVEEEKSLRELSFEENEN